MTFIQNESINYTKSMTDSIQYIFTHNPESTLTLRKEKGLSFESFGKDTLEKNDFSKYITFSNPLDEYGYERAIESDVDMTMNLNNLANLAIEFKYFGYKYSLSLFFVNEHCKKRFSKYGNNYTKIIVTNRPENFSEALYGESEISPRMLLSNDDIVIMTITELLNYITGIINVNTDNSIVTDNIDYNNTEYSTDNNTITDNTKVNNNTNTNFIQYPSSKNNSLMALVENYLTGLSSKLDENG